MLQFLLGGTILPYQIDAIHILEMHAGDDIHHLVGIDYLLREEAISCRLFDSINIILFHMEEG